MKKLAIVAIILVGGGIFAGYMVETNNHQIEPKKVEQTIPTTAVITNQSDTKIDDQGDKPKVDSESSQPIKKVQEISNPKAEVTQPVVKVNNEVSTSSNVDKSVSRNNVSDINQVQNKKSNNNIVSTQVNNSNSTDSQKDDTTNINSNNKNINSSNDNIVSNNKNNNTNSSKNNNKSINLVNSSNKASELVKEYYQKKFPSVNQTNWSTEVSDNQTIDGKTGYLVRLYNYMNNHSNNIAWILVESNGNMYSTEAGSGPVIKLS